MPLPDIVLFLTEPNNPLRLVFDYVTEFLPRFDEHALLRLAAFFSPTRPIIRSLFVRYVAGVSLSMTHQSLSNRPRSISKVQSTLSMLPTMEVQLEVCFRCDWHFQSAQFRRCPDFLTIPTRRCRLTRAWSSMCRFCLP